MDLSEIQELIKFVAKAGVNEVEIEKFIFVYNAMGKALPFIKAHRYTKF